MASGTAGTGGVVVFPSCLKNSPTDVPVASLTLYSKLGVVICFTVWNPILADVFSSQHSATGLTLEAADVPLLLQGQQGLALLDLLITACTMAGSVDLDGLIGADKGVGALLTNTLLPTECHSVSDGKRLPALAADEALGVVGAAQG